MGLSEKRIAPLVLGGIIAAGAAYQSWAAPLDGWQVLTGSGSWSYQSMKVRPQQLNPIFVPQVDATNCSVAFDHVS